jgi:glucosamine 6-phosphate synthetase-like amidotransferase/phosphosugar isomerase protein
MCGIVGYVGPRGAEEFLLEGLRRLEYRGYDSAGLATLTPQREFHVTKAVGRIETLAQKLADHPTPGNLGIGHTRWATHGAPSEANAHPHFGGGDSASSAVLTLAHNGVIENYVALKEKLLAEGYTFQSSTDTEAIGHLIARYLAQFMERREEFGTVDPYALPLAAITKAVSKLRGTYGLVVLLRDWPEAIFVARQGGDRRRRRSWAAFRTTCSRRSSSSPNRSPRTRCAAGSTTRRHGGVRRAESDAAATARVNRIMLTACGTSWHAALVGEYLIEELARIPGRGRVRQRTALSQSAGGPTARCCLPSRKAARRPTRWPPCAR